MVFCRFCTKFLKPKITNIQDHAKSKRHKVETSNSEVNSNYFCFGFYASPLCNQIRYLLFLLILKINYQLQDSTNKQSDVKDHYSISLPLNENNCVAKANLTTSFHNKVKQFGIRTLSMNQGKMLCILRRKKQNLTKPNIFKMDLEIMHLHNVALALQHSTPRKICSFT